MQYISDPNYATIFADPAHQKEWKAVIYDGETGTEYGQDNIVSIRLNSQLYGNALIGNACSGSMDLALANVSSENIPKMAKIKIFTRLVGKEVNETIIIPRGRMRGDINGNGTIEDDGIDWRDGGRSDVAYINGYLANLGVDLDEIQYWCADTGGDGVVLSDDAIRLIRRIAWGNVDYYPNVDYYGNWTWRSTYHDWMCFIPTDIPRGIDIDMPSGYSYEYTSGGINVFAENAPISDFSIRVHKKLQSEWLPKGTYWVNQREEDTVSDTVTLHCVDGMMFGERDFFLPNDPISPWENETMRTVAGMCAEKMGLTLEDPNQFQNAQPYRLTAPPEGYTVRQVLSGIAAAHGGNVIVTQNNKIRLVPFIPTNTHVNIGTNIANFTLAKQYEAFGQVIFNFEGIDGDTLTVLYPDTDEPEGSIIETKMLAVTDSEDAEDMVQAVYQSLGSYLYTPYNATDAILDPAMELGDGLTINGTYSILASLDEICDALYSATIGAPSFDETENEFVYQPKTEKNIERKLSKTKTSFSVRVDGIEGRVEGLDDSVTSLNLGVGKLEAMVSGLAPDWASGTDYQLRDLVKHNGLYYTCIEAHKSTSSFDPSKWSEGIEQATLQNAIKLNIADGLVLSSSAGSDENSCHISLKYGIIELFGQDILMNNVTAERLKAQTINAHDVNVSGALQFYGEVNYPGYETNTYYRVNDKIFGTVYAGDISGLSSDVTGIFRCVVAHNSGQYALTLDYGLKRWELDKVMSELGGYIGFGTGKAGSSTQPTKGVVLASGAEGQGGYGTGDHYIIATDSGVRLQDNQTNFYLAGGHIRYSLNGTDYQELGYAVFS